MDRLVEDLTDAAGIGAGTFSLKPESTHLAAVVARVVEAQQGTAPAHELALEVEDEVEGLWDKDRLEQVPTNPARNAIAYSRTTARLSSGYGKSQRRLLWR
jgi:signal transduction histidine kinase